MENIKYEKLDFSNIFFEKYKEFTPIVNEYFSRMKLDLNLSDEEILKKVNLLIKNVDKIGFGLIPGNNKGGFVPSIRRILINVDLLNYKQDGQLLLDILTHELDHATNYDVKNKGFGMYRYDKNNQDKFNPQDELLDEMRTDIGSTRRVYNENYIDEEKMIRKTVGHKKFTAFSTMLINCLGITEKEFVQSSKNGRASFDKSMKCKFQNPDDYFKFMERFTLGTSILLNESRKNVDVIMENKNIYDSAFKNLKELSYIGLNLKMEKDILDNNDLNLDEYLKDIRYSVEENSRNFIYAQKEFALENRLNKILKSVLNYNFEDIENFEKGQHIDIKSKAQNILESKIMYLELIEENKELLGDKYIVAIQKVTSVRDISKLKEYAKEELGLEYKDNDEAEYKKKLDAKTSEIRKSKKENSYRWNNSEVLKYIDAAFCINKNKGINIILSKVVRKRRQDKSNPSVENKTVNRDNDESVIDKFKRDVRSNVMSDSTIYDTNKKNEFKIEKDKSESVIDIK